jgi:serpin B
MRTAVSSGFIIAFVALDVGCGSGETQTSPLATSTLPRESVELSGAEKLDLSTSLSGFAFSLWQNVRNEPAAADNLAISPTSVSLALGMAYAGAKAETASQMAAAMHVTSPSETYLRCLNWLGQQLESRAPDALKRAQENYTNYGGNGAAPDPANYRLHVVNACWGDRTLTFEQPYLDTLARDFGSGVHLADFATRPEAERTAINTWVAQETEKRIADLIPPGVISAATRSVLVNAIHLKLPWFDPFQQAGTKPGSFTKVDGSTVSVPFMNRKTSIPYAEDDTVQVIALSLAGNSIEFVVFLPKPTTTLAQWEDSLSPTYVQTLVANMITKPQYVALSLPKFTFTTASISIAKALATLGMTDAFSASADFTGITQERPFFITDVVHKAMIGVDENGVEAAAATAVAMGMGIPPEPKDMTINRPFFFGIYDIPTATWLFLGHVTDPSREVL